MVGNNSLEKKHWIKRIEGVGCCMPIEKKAYDQVVLAFSRDLVIARQHSEKGKPNSAYFMNKVKVIEESLNRFIGKGKKEDKHDVGYDVCHKYIYQGLPVEFAEAIDPPILEIMELIAECKHVAMTGSCCAGHPSRLLVNPYLHSSQNDPEFSEKAKARHNFEEFIYTENLSPHLALVLYRNGMGAWIANMLSEIKAVALPEGDVDNLEIAGYLKVIEGPQPSKLLTILLDGHPTIYINGKAMNGKGSQNDKAIGYDEFVPLYQEALCAFWRNIKSIFEIATGGGVQGPEPHQFVPKGNLEWDNDYRNYLAKVSKGYQLPHYLYFNGNGNNTLLKPEMLR